MTLDKIIEKQVKRFDKTFPVKKWEELFTLIGTKPFIKTFLRQAIRQAVEEYEKLLIKKEK